MMPATISDRAAPEKHPPVTPVFTAFLVVKVDLVGSIKGEAFGGRLIELGDPVDAQDNKPPFTKPTMTRPSRRRKIKNPSRVVRRKQKRPSERKAPTLSVPEAVRGEWDTKLTLLENYEKMGLVASLNGRTGGMFKKSALKERAEGPKKTAWEVKDVPMDEDAAITAWLSAPSTSAEKNEQSTADAEDSEPESASADPQVDSDVELPRDFVARSGLSFGVSIGSRAVPKQKRQKTDLVKKLEELAENVRKCKRHMSSLEFRGVKELVEKHGDNYSVRWQLEFSAFLRLTLLDFEFRPWLATSNSTRSNKLPLSSGKRSNISTSTKRNWTNWKSCLRSKADRPSKGGSERAGRELEAADGRCSESWIFLYGNEVYFSCCGNGAAVFLNRAPSSRKIHGFRLRQTGNGRQIYFIQTKKKNSKIPQLRVRHDLINGPKHIRRIKPVLTNCIASSRLQLSIRKLDNCVQSVDAGSKSAKIETEELVAKGVFAVGFIAQTEVSTIHAVDHLLVFHSLAHVASFHEQFFERLFGLLEQHSARFVNLLAQMGMLNRSISSRLAQMIISPFAFRLTEQIPG